MAFTLCFEFSAGEFFVTKRFQWYFIDIDFMESGENDGLKMKNNCKCLKPRENNGHDMTLYIKATI